MRVRIIVVLMILTISIMSSSCSHLSYVADKTIPNKYPNLNPDLMGKVQVISDNEGSYYLKYNGQCYYIDKQQMFQVRERMYEIPKEDVLIGWYTVPYGIWYLDEYYSYTADNPVFIYLSRINELYIRSDYDYKTDVFVIDKTEHYFAFSDMLTLSNAISYDAQSHYPKETNIILYSQQHPRLKLHLRIFCVDNVWYAGGNTDSILFEVTDELLSLLDINGEA